MTLEERIEAAEAKRNRAIWPYFPGPLYCGLVWIVDDAQGAFFTAVGMLLAILFCMYEVGRKMQFDELRAKEQPHEG